MEIGFVHKGLDEFMHRIDVVFNRLVISSSSPAAPARSSLIGIFATDGPQILGIHVLSVLGFVLSGLPAPGCPRRLRGSPPLERERLPAPLTVKAWNEAAHDDEDAAAVTDAEPVPGRGRSGRRRQRRAERR